MHHAKQPAGAPRPANDHTRLYALARGGSADLNDWLRQRDRNPIYKRIEILALTIADQVPSQRDAHTEDTIDKILGGHFMNEMLVNLERITDPELKPVKLEPLEALSFALRLSSRIMRPLAVKR